MWPQDLENAATIVVHRRARPTPYAMAVRSRTDRTDGVASMHLGDRIAYGLPASISLRAAGLDPARGNAARRGPCASLERRLALLTVGVPALGFVAAVVLAAVRGIGALEVG